MALTVCMNCDQTYLEQEPSCRHCGARNPGVMGAARHVAAEFQRMSMNAQTTDEVLFEKPLTFWGTYSQIIKTLWTSVWWYLFILTVVVLGLEGQINNPKRVFYGFLFVGFIFAPLLGYLYFLADRAATKRGFKV